ncbi:MAG TPA: ACT domain-containing protein [Kofleriaceae bacterium]|nr:ACT domain-containing protein [Kofleriaceae bacterium]
MRDTLVLTLIGNDRTGLVQSVAEKLSSLGANWEEARMARLAGQFAGILLVTIEAGKTDELVASLRTLDAAGLQVTARRTAAPEPATDHSVLKLTVTANDRPGIVRDVSRVLAERGINVEDLETEVTSAAMSGGPLFNYRALIRAPGGVALDDLRARLEALGSELMVDLSST